VLHDLGLRTTLARTCAEARAAASTRPLVAVLADLNLPDGTGITLLNELLPGLGLENRGALITGAENPEVLYPVLSKPFRLDQVAVLMRSLLTPG
jgi:CheY-like chemotaxis protein